MIEDETGLIPLDDFRKLFFTYFKGNDHESKVFSELVPSLTIVKEDGSIWVQILKFTSFIDMYNYYPLKMQSIKDKNDSNELSYIMSSNTRGNYKNKLNDS